MLRCLGENMLVRVFPAAAHCGLGFIGRKDFVSGVMNRVQIMMSEKRRRIEATWQTRHVTG